MRSVIGWKSMLYKSIEKYSRSGEKHSTTSCVSPYTSFML